MVLICSVVGVCLLFVLSFFDFYKKNSKSSIKDYLLSEIFRGTAIQFICVVLGVTIAINFADRLDSISYDKKMKELIKICTSEVATSLFNNEEVSRAYEDGKLTLEDLKDNTYADVYVLENIFESEHMMLSTSAVTYLGIKSRYKNGEFPLF